MAVLSDINSKIQRMDAACFQQFGDEMLRKLYHPINVESRGTKIGEVKTIKGTPDTIFTTPYGTVLIEYTTQSSSNKNVFLNKLKSDIDSCLNEGKTNVSIERVCEIIIFANQRIAIDVQEKLKEYLKPIYSHIKLTFFSIDDISIKIKDYPGLMKDYLGIVSQPGLIEIDAFINKFTSAKLSFPIPLDNIYFEIESLPLSHGVKMLEDNNIIVISGSAGMGKTRYAIEIAKAYTNKTGTRLLVFEEKNQNAREILDNLDSDTSYLFLIDDANRTSIWEEVVEYYSHSPNNRIKFIATVRDYAKESVMQECSSLKQFSHIEIPDSSETITKKILESFGITSPIWHERIESIAGKNIRLAVMCAQIALSGNKYEELINVESIYNAYYSSALSDLLKHHENRILIKVIAIISFYKVVDLDEETLLQQISNVFGITAKVFIDTAHILNELECIDIDENIAIVPDQNFGNYMFYQCFFLLREISLCNLIKNLYHRSDRIIDSLYSVINCFHNNAVTDILQTSVSEAWEDVCENEKEEDKICFIRIFANIIPYKTFLYVNQLIEDSRYKDRTSSISCHDNIISILSHFSHSNEYEINCALSYLVNYLSINPDKIELAGKTISEEWVYDINDYLHSYERSTTIIDTLIRLAQDSETGFNLASITLPHFLNFSYNITRNKGNKFVFGWYSVVVSDELKQNRRKIWKWIIANIARLNQEVFTKNLYSNSYRAKSIAKELVLEEIDCVREALEKMNIKDDYNLCHSIKNLCNRIKQIIGKECILIDWENANYLYLLDCKITNKPKDIKSKPHEIVEKNIQNIIKKMSVTEIKNLIDDIVQIAKLNKTNEPFRLSYIIEGIISTDIDVALQTWQYIIDKEYKYIATRIIYSYLASANNISRLIEFIREQEITTKSNLILEFICCVDNPSGLITVDAFCNALINYSEYSCNLDFIVNRYFATELIIAGQRKVMTTLLLRIRNNRDITGTEQFLQEFCTNNPTKLKIVENAYIHGIKQNNDYDHKNNLLKNILSRDSSFWVKCCQRINYFAKISHITPYDFIWALKNHSQIIESTLLYYGGKSYIPYSEEDNLFSFFSNIKGEEAAKFMDCMIAKYCKNRDVSSLLFRIVISCMGNSRVQHFITFITNNSSISDFYHLETRPRTMYGGDSFASAVKANIDFISELLEAITSLKSTEYLEHLNYLSNVKESMTKEYKRELKRGHKNRLYN